MQRYSGVVQDSQGNAVNGASVTVYYAGTANPAIVYSAAGSPTAPSQISNPFTTDALGNYSFAAPDGRYDIKLSGGTIPSFTIPNVCMFDNVQTYPSPMLGTVTSVALSMPGTEFAVTGSPVTSSGSFSVTWNSQAQDLVFASPGGASGTPAFRALTTSHLPTTGITSVGSFGSATAIPGITVDAYGRVTAVTTYTPSVDWANITSKPTTAAGWLVDAALLGVQNTWTKAQNVTPYANATASGSFTPDLATYDTFNMTLVGNISIVNPSPIPAGAKLVFNFTQDGVGSRLATWGTAFKWPGGTTPALSTAAGARDTVTATYDGTSFRCNISKAYS